MAAVSDTVSRLAGILSARGMKVFAVTGQSTLSRDLGVPMLELATDWPYRSRISR